MNHYHHILSLSCYKRFFRVKQITLNRSSQMFVKWTLSIFFSSTVPRKLDRYSPMTNVNDCISIYANISRIISYNFLALLCRVFRLESWIGRIILLPACPIDVSATRFSSKNCNQQTQQSQLSTNKLNVSPLPLLNNQWCHSPHQLQTTVEQLTTITTRTATVATIVAFSITSYPDPTRLWNFTQSLTKHHRKPILSHHYRTTSTKHLL